MSTARKIPRRDDDKIAMLEGQLDSAEQVIEELTAWLSYMYGMRTVKLSGLFWGHFAKYMESRGLDLSSISFDRLPLPR